MARRSEPTSPQVPQLLDALESGIEELRIEYEKYFLGIERMAPAKLHKTVESALRDLEAMRPRSTVLRFRLDGLRARFVTYRHYWTRILTQIENGTHRRDRHRAMKRVEPAIAPRDDAAVAGATSAAGAGTPTDAAAPIVAPPGLSPIDPRPGVAPPNVTLPGANDAAAVPSAAAPRRVPPPPPPAAPTIPGMDRAATRKLYDDLVAAKRAAGEDTAGLAYNALVRKLSREATRYREQHGTAVRFEVAHVGGKVTLRARPISKPA